MPYWDRFNVKLATKNMISIKKFRYAKWQFNRMQTARKTVAHNLNLSPGTVEMRREAITQRVNYKRILDAVNMLHCVSNKKTN